jgi:Flp pilus assembly protein TadD
VESDYSAGRSSLLSGQFRAAATSFRRVIAAQPGHAGAHRGLGMALAESGDRPGAARALRRYLTLSPGAGDAGTIRRKLETLEGSK